MKIPKQLIIYQTKHWMVNHRINAHLPGYLILSSTHNNINQLSDLPLDALNELTPLQALVEKRLNDIASPAYIYMGRYGHTPKLPIHFHIIPVYQWVIDLFWQDTRYRTLQEFGNTTSETLTDGAELTLYIWREFCESNTPPSTQGLSKAQIITCLKDSFLASHPLK